MPEGAPEEPIGAAPEILDNLSECLSEPAGTEGRCPVLFGGGLEFLQPRPGAGLISPRRTSSRSRSFITCVPCLLFQRIAQLAALCMAAG